MADDLSIVVGGDLGPLESAVSAAAATAQTAGHTIADAMNTGLIPMNAMESAVTAARAAIGQFSSSAQETAGAAAQLGSSLADVDKELRQKPTDAQNAADAIKQFGAELKGAGTALLVVGGALSTLSVALEETARSSVDTAGNFERVHITLTTLIGSSQAASAEMDHLIGVANASGVAIDTAFRGFQNMLARGFDVSHAESAFQALTAASAALNLPMDQLIRSFDSLQTRGTAALQQMARAGIPVWQLLSQAAGVSIDRIREIVRKGALDTDTVMDTLIDGIERKWGGLPAQIAKSWGGLKTQLANQVELALNALGQALLPAAKAVAEVFITVLKVLQDVAEFFGKLPAPIQDAVIAVTALVAAVGPLTLALGGLLFAAGSIVANLPALAALLGVELPAAFLASKVAAIDTTVAIEANAAAAATAGGAGGGVTLLAGALGKLRQAALIAAAAFTGWELGKWLDQNVPAWGSFFGTIADGLLSLKAQLAGVAPVSDQALSAVTQLAEQLRAMGVVIDRGDLSLKDYAKAVVAAAEAHHLIITSTTAMTPRIDLAAEAFKKMEKAQIDADASVKEAAAALNVAKVLYAEHAVKIDVVTRAQNAYTKALQDAHPALIGAAKDVKDLSTNFNEASKTIDQYSNIIQKFPGLVTSSMSQLRQSIVDGFNPAEAIKGIDTLIAKMNSLAAAGDTDAANIAAFFSKGRQEIINMLLALDPTKLQAFDVNGVQVLKGGLDAAGKSAGDLAASLSKNLNIPLAASQEIIKAWQVGVRDSQQALSGFNSTVQNGVRVITPFTDQLQRHTSVSHEAAQAITAMQQAQALINSTWQIGQDNAGRVALSVAQIGNAHANAINQVRIAKDVYDQIHQSYVDGTSSIQEMQTALDDWVAAAKQAIDPTNKLGGSIGALAQAAATAGGDLEAATNGIESAVAGGQKMSGMFDKAGQSISSFAAASASGLDGASTSLTNYIGLLRVLGADSYTISQAAAAAGYTIQQGMFDFVTPQKAFEIALASGNYSLSGQTTHFTGQLPSNYQVDPTTGFVKMISATADASKALDGLTASANKASAASSASASQAQQFIDAWNKSYQYFLSLGDSIQQATDLANQMTKGFQGVVQGLSQTTAATTAQTKVYQALSDSVTTVAGALDTVSQAAIQAAVASGQITEAMVEGTLGIQWATEQVASAAVMIGVAAAAAIQTVVAADPTGMMARAMASAPINMGAPTMTGIGSPGAASVQSVQPQWGLGPQITVNVTGNTVANDASINQLAQRVSQSLVTNLRMNAGLKLS